MEVFHDTATESHLPYGITLTQCYLLPDTSETPRLNSSHTGRYSIYLPRRDGRPSWPIWLDSAPGVSRTSDLSIMSLTLNHCAS